MMARTLHCLSVSLLALLYANSVLAFTTANFAKSEVIFLARPMNVPIDGKFRRVSGQIKLDLAHLGASMVHVEIDVASLDLGIPTTEVELKKSKWFAADRFPVARFVARDIRRIGERQFEAVGEFTLKGVTKALVVPFILVRKSGGEAVEGTISINRLDFNVGEAEWADQKLIGKNVQVHFNVPLT